MLAQKLFDQIYVIDIVVFCYIYSWDRCCFLLVEEQQDGDDDGMTRQKTLWRKNQ